MKLWPFSKKPEPASELDSKCDLPDGVILASPLGLSEATPISMVSMQQEQSPANHIADLLQPNRSELLEQAEASTALMDFGISSQKGPDFQPDNSAIGQFESPVLQTSSLMPDLQAPVQPFMPETAPEVLSDASSQPLSSAPARVNQQPSSQEELNSLFSEMLASNKMPTEAEPVIEMEPASMQDLSPSLLEPEPAFEEPSPVKLDTTDSIASLASNALPDLSETFNADIDLTPPEPMQSSETEHLPQSSLAMLADMIPSSEQNLMQDFGPAPDWDLQPESSATESPASLQAMSDEMAYYEQVGHVSSSSLDKELGASSCLLEEDLLAPPPPSHMEPSDAMGSDLYALGDEIPADETGDWNGGEEDFNDPIELNSSAAAYDLNHYDDPDEPTPAIEITQETESAASSGNLQDMANLLANMLPNERAADALEPILADTAADIPTWDAAVPSLDGTDSLHQADPQPGFGEDFWQTAASEMDASLEIGMDTSLAMSQPDVAMEAPPEMPPMPEQPAMLQEESGTAEILDEIFATNAQENGAKSSNGSAGDILAALSAKFIARPKPEPLADPLPLEPEPEWVATEPVKLSAELSAAQQEHSMDKPKPQSITQAMGSFEEEILLTETRFIKKSINNLVDRYFAQRDLDSTW